MRSPFFILTTLTLTFSMTSFAACSSGNVEYVIAQPANASDPAETYAIWYAGQKEWVHAELNADDEPRINARALFSGIVGTGKLYWSFHAAAKAAEPASQSQPAGK